MFFITIFCSYGRSVYTFFHLLNLFNNLAQLYLCGIGGTGTVDLKKSLQHSLEGSPVNSVQSVRMKEQKGFQPANLSEGGNIYKVIILDIISETHLRDTQ